MESSLRYYSHDEKITPKQYSTLYKDAFLLWNDLFWNESYPIYKSWVTA